AEEVDHSRIHRLSRGRKEVQVAQASPAHAVQHDARAISREMELGARLSDGGAELRGRPLAARQADGSRPAAQAAEIAIDVFSVFISIRSGCGRWRTPIFPVVW